MNKLILTIVTAALCSVSIAPLHAQPALKRLEEQIRAQRPAPATTPQPVPGGKPSRPAGENSEARRAEEAKLAETGYLGVLANDEPAPGSGVRILQVHKGGPADTAGLRAEDLITAVGGAPVQGMADMADILGKVPPGGVIAFDVRRGQERRRIDVTLGRRPAPEERPSEPPIGQLPPPPAPPQLAHEDQQGPSDDRARIEALESRVRELERRVADLEKAMRVGSRE